MSAIEFGKQSDFCCKSKHSLKRNVNPPPPLFFLHTRFFSFHLLSNTSSVMKSNNISLSCQEFYDFQIQVCTTHNTLTCDFPKDFLTPITGKCFYPEGSVIKSMEDWTPWPYGHRSHVCLTYGEQLKFICSFKTSLLHYHYTIHVNLMPKILCLKRFIFKKNPAYKSLKHDDRNLLLLFPTFLETYFFQVYNNLDYNQTLTNCISLRVEALRAIWCM